MVTSDHFNLTLQHLIYNKVITSFSSTTATTTTTSSSLSSSSTTTLSSFLSSIKSKTSSAVITLRPPVKFPVLPHYHHGPRWGPYFEEETDKQNVTVRVGTTVQLDCKIGMLQDKMVSLFFLNLSFRHLFFFYSPHMYRFELIQSKIRFSIFISKF